VSWRKIVGMILFSPIMVGLLAVLVLGIIWKLPMFFCERCRAVRYLPYVGLAYYGLVVPTLLVAFGLRWWEVLMFTVILALISDWLLPDPFTYFFNPRKRRAVKLAIEYVDAGEELWPNYSRVHVVGLEADRTIISVELKSSTKPPARLFVAVADKTPALEVLDFEYVSTRHGVRGWY